MKGCLRSFTFKNIHVNEHSRERLWPRMFGNVRQRSKKVDVNELYNTKKSRNFIDMITIYAWNL